MVKIAICLSGYLSYKQRSPLRTKILYQVNKQLKMDSLLKEPFSKDHPILGFNSLKRITDKYDTDFFIHSWDEENTNVINNIYKPKKYFYEKQKKFCVNLKDYGVEENNLNTEKWKVSNNAKMGYKLLFDNRVKQKKYDKKQIMNELKIQIFRVSSRFYSIKKSIELKNLYEKEKNFKYDFVIVCRFGCNWSFKINLDYNKINNDLFYVNGRFGRLDEKYTINDLWFIANSENINHLSTYFENRFKYCTRPPFALFEHLNKYVKFKLI